MKEATGELNMTVIAIVAIAAVAAFFYAIIWPSIKTNIEMNQKCANAVCNNCINGTCTCYEAGSTNSITCPDPNK